MRDGEEFFLELVRDGTLSIDSKGRIWRRYWIHPFTPGRVKLKKPRRAEEKGRYLRLATYRNKKSIRASAHRVVYIYFFGDVIDDCEVDHKNFDKHDNCPENLEAVSHEENMRRADEGGRRHMPHLKARGVPKPRGESDPKSLLSNKEAREIRALAGKLSQYAIAKKFGVSRSTIQAIINGRTYQI